MILRRIARPMLSTIFVASGIDSVRNPTGRAAVAGEFIEGSLNALPPNVSAALPHNPETIVRINGAIQLAGGLLLATGKAPRLASLGLLGTLIPTTLAGHPWWQETDPAKRNMQRTQFYKNISIAGGLLIAAADTEGKPSLAWLGRQKANAATAAVAAAIPLHTKDAPKAWDSLVERTQEGAATLGERSEDAAEKLRDNAAAVAEFSTEAAEKLRDRAPEIAEVARERSVEFAERLRERAPEIADAARERSAEWAELISERSAEWADALTERAPELAESAKSLAHNATEKAEAGKRRWRKARA